MNKFLTKQIQEYNQNNQKGPNEFKKYLVMFGVVFVNAMFIYPLMKKYYQSYFTNKDAEVTHIVISKYLCLVVLF
jgi:hypothetical protein